MIGTAYGLFRFNPQTEALAHFGPEQGLADERVYALALPTAGNPRTLIGTWSGVYALDSDAHIQRFPLTCDGRAFDPGLIWDMRRDRQGRLWLGTSVGLLRLLDSQSGAVELIDQRQGLSNNVIYGIEFDAADRLWLSSNRGLMRFDANTLQVKLIDVDSGLQGIEFGYALHAHDAQGRLYFGGVGGVNAFNTALADIEIAPPLPLITALELANRPLVPGVAPELAQSIANSSRLIWPYESRDPGFHFSVYSGALADRQRVQYRLLGLDKRWIEAGERRFVSYTNLSPGTYAFELRAREPGSAFSPVHRLELIIEPAFFQRVWFRTAAIALVLLMIYGLMR